MKPKATFSATILAIKEDLGLEWLPTIYQNVVRPQRTRLHTIDVPLRENNAEIMYTLLGIELKVGRRRFSCPDLAAARYMRVFARLGCSDLAVPYDITKISAIADEMELSWHKTLHRIKSASEFLSARDAARLRSGVIKQMRDEIIEIGAGERIPEFRQSTKQRPG